MKARINRKRRRVGSTQHGQDKRGMGGDSQAAEKKLHTWRPAAAHIKRIKKTIFNHRAPPFHYSPWRIAPRPGGFPSLAPASRARSTRRGSPRVSPSFSVASRTSKSAGNEGRQVVEEVERTRLSLGLRSARGDWRRYGRALHNSRERRSQPPRRYPFSVVGAIVSNVVEL